MLVLKLGSPISSDMLGQAQTLDTGTQVLRQILHADETPGQQTGESHGWQRCWSPVLDLMVIDVQKFRSLVFKHLITEERF